MNGTPGLACGEGALQDALCLWPRVCGIHGKPLSGLLLYAASQKRAFQGERRRHRAVYTSAKVGRTLSSSRALPLMHRAVGGADTHTHV